jgi:hypothetical protein
VTPACLRRSDARIPLAMPTAQHRAAWRLTVQGQDRVTDDASRR